jgi:hypothetical protein
LFKLCASLTFVIGVATTALAQAPELEDRQTVADNAAAEKAKTLVPYQVTLAEKVITRIENRFTDQAIYWHPFLQNAYQGGGFAAGAGTCFTPAPTAASTFAAATASAPTSLPKPSSWQRACLTDAES